MTREEAIKQLEKHTQYKLNGKDLVALDMAIKALEQETVTEFADRCRECGERYDKLLKEKTLRWIPVSERLPENSGRYLAYIVNKHDEKLQYIMTCDYLVDGYWNWFPDDECASDNVIAWMPLPQPYKGESEVRE